MGGLGPAWDMGGTMEWRFEEDEVAAIFVFPFSLFATCYCTAGSLICVGGVAKSGLLIVSILELGVKEEAPRRIPPSLKGEGIRGER